MFCLCVCFSFFPLTSCFGLQIRNYYYFSRNMRETTSVCWNFSKSCSYLYAVHVTSAHVICKHWICVFNCRSFLWGPAAVEHHKTRKSLGASLWQQASSDDLLALLKTDRMLQTIEQFPQQRRIVLQVSILFQIYFPEQHFSKKLP